MEGPGARRASAAEDVGREVMSESSIEIRGMAV